MSTDLPLSAGTFFTDRVNRSLNGPACSSRRSISGRSSEAMSRRSLRAMFELGKVIERAEYRHEQRDHRDECRMMARQWPGEEDECGHKQRARHARSRNF